MCERKGPLNALYISLNITLHTYNYKQFRCSLYVTAIYSYTSTYIIYTCTNLCLHPSTACAKLTKRICSSLHCVWEQRKKDSLRFQVECALKLTSTATTTALLATATAPPQIVVAIVFIFAHFCFCCCCCCGIYLIFPSSLCHNLCLQRNGQIESPRESETGRKAGSAVSLDSGRHSMLQSVRRGRRTSRFSLLLWFLLLLWLIFLFLYLCSTSCSCCCCHSPSINIVSVVAAI